jgi:hypothetical protein
MRAGLRRNRPAQLKGARLFHGWDNFYFMMGSAGAGLIGLLFVVITLTAGFERTRALRGSQLYLTPNMVHFANVLVVSAVAMAPGLPAPVVAGLIGLVALTGLARAIGSSIGIRASRTDDPPPHWSDFWFYGVAPGVVYVAILVAAGGICRQTAWAPYLMATMLLTLMLLAIRNAWDLITWIAPGPPQPNQPTPPPA